jgi:predicted nuclease of restriction endonuclease-like (RecB) superfamily
MAAKRSQKAVTLASVKTNSSAASTTRLLGDIRNLIEASRSQVAQAVNAGLVLLYWNIGDRIQRDILGNKRADYGQKIVHALSAQLAVEYGQGFSLRNLFHMVRFAEVYPDQKIVSALSKQLGWTHFRQLIYLDDPLKRDFYAEMCRIERWSTRALEKKIGGMLYERTALSKKPAVLVKQELAALREKDRMTPDLVFRDPYILDFLGLKNAYSEKDLETAILRELEQFLIELGTDFTFVARQKRLTGGRNDYYLDLLFYHRRLRCLVAIELKLDKFKPADKGQMELYLRWLEKYDMRPGENPPLGIILCAGKEQEEVELLQLGDHGIRVAEYLTELPPRHLIEKKLHEAIILVRERLEHEQKRASSNKKR